MPYSRLPRHLVLAFVAAEDARFFEHPGVDITGIARAFFRNLEAGEVVQGGSTITQQVVKRILLTSEKSFARKIREAVLAYRIDNYMTKEEILSVYLNHIFLGHGAYGVEAAAQEYFSKHVEDLNLAEVAILAGIPKAPSRYDPYLNPQRAKERQAYVLRRMAEVGFISKEAGGGSLPAAHQAETLPAGMDQGMRLLQRAGADPAGGPVRQGIGLQHGAEGLYHCGRRPAQGGPGGHRIRDRRPDPAQRLPGAARHVRGKELTTFQERQAKYYRKYPPRKGQAVTALVVGAPDRRRASGLNFRLGEQWGVLREAGGTRSRATTSMASLRPGTWCRCAWWSGSARARWTGELIAAPMVQAALVSMELKTGKVRVLMGGKDFGDSTFNRATQARRQPGSAFKPILYAAAVEKGFRPDSILQDSPISLPGGKHGQVWSPQNYDHRFYGPIPLAYCHSPFPQRAGGAPDDGHRRPGHGQHGQDPGNHQPHLSQLCLGPGSFRCHPDGADPGLLRLSQ